LGFLSGSNDTPRVLFRGSTGRVAIGTNSADCPSHVASSTSISLNSFAEYSSSSGSPHIWIPDYGYLPTRDISIKANENILAQIYYLRKCYALSDERIKENIVDVVDHQALELSRQLKPKKYQYKDKVSRGDREVFGFLAQEVEEILPECVNKRTELLPS